MGWYINKQVTPVGQLLWVAVDDCYIGSIPLITCMKHWGTSSCLTPVGRKLEIWQPIPVHHWASTVSRGMLQWREPQVAAGKPAGVGKPVPKRHEPGTGCFGGPMLGVLTF